MKHHVRAFTNILAITCFALASCAPRLEEGKIWSGSTTTTDGGLIYSGGTGLFLKIFVDKGQFKMEDDASPTHYFISPDGSKALFIYDAVDITKEPIEECFETISGAKVLNSNSNDPITEYTITEECTEVKVESRDEIPNGFQPLLGVRANK